MRAVGFFFLYLSGIFWLFLDQGSPLKNPAVEASSTNHLFGLHCQTMIRCSDSPTFQGGKAPNQPSDGLSSTRVAHGLPCMRTSCA